VHSSTSNSDSARRIRALRSWRPLALGCLTAVAFVIGWRTIVEPRLPVAIQRQVHEPGPVHWFDPGPIPLYLTGPEVTPDTWLFIGDSRVFHAIDPPSLAAAGVEPVTLLWIGGAQMEDLLVVARQLPSRRLVVTFTPLSLRHERDMEAERRMVRRRENIPWRQRVDRTLSSVTDRYRARLVRWIGTATWDTSWFATMDPSGTDAALTRALGPASRPNRLAALDRISILLRELRAEGRDITCVRFPISPSLEAIEDESLDPELFARVTRDLGIPYYDDAGMHLPTLDGSHLTWPSARSYSRLLAERLLQR